MPRDDDELVVDRRDEDLARRYGIAARVRPARLFLAVLDEIDAVGQVGIAEAGVARQFDGDLGLAAEIFHLAGGATPVAGELAAVVAHRATGAHDAAVVVLQLLTD